MDQPGPDKFQSPEELKWTPNSAMDMRFGRRGEARPHRSVDPAADKVPKKASRRRPKPYEVFFGVAFALIAAFMVAGALSFLLPDPIQRSYERQDKATAAAEAEAAADAPVVEEEDRELQGGVKVRKGFGGK